MLNILTNDNGAGLTKDANILSEFIDEPCHRSQAHALPKGKYELNIFCEVVNERWFKAANKNVLIPNPEWYHKKWLGHIKDFDEIWVKTKESERIFSELHHNVKFIGFTSEDHYQEGAKEFKGFHACGKSQAKQTWLILNNAEKLPFHVTVLAKLQGIHKMMAMGKIKQKQFRGENINQINTQDKGLPQDQFNRLQNECLIHICPSTYEGFGHYINEARSCGAVVVTTDAAPMNELITEDIGFLVEWDNVKKRELGADYFIKSRAFMEVLEKVNNTPFEKLVEMGNLARERFLEEREQFRTKINAAVQAIL